MIKIQIMNGLFKIQGPDSITIILYTLLWSVCFTLIVSDTLMEY